MLVKWRILLISWSIICILLIVSLLFSHKQHTPPRHVGAGVFLCAWHRTLTPPSPTLDLRHRRSGTRSRCPSDTRTWVKWRSQLGQSRFQRWKKRWMNCGLHQYLSTEDLSGRGSYDCHQVAEIYNECSESRLNHRLVNAFTDCR